ncbi:MAG: hypothetical protein Q8P20_08030 [bacterium]|nr:hypothetical protein [bacterium]MDZ4227889.1 hypothetical protein [Candidatus Levybacteria bacterium]
MKFKNWSEVFERFNVDSNINSKETKIFVIESFVWVGLFFIILKDYSAGIGILAQLLIIIVIAIIVFLQLWMIFIKIYGLKLINEIIIERDALEFQYHKLCGEKRKNIKNGGF